jgi:hypothetical protein
MADNAAQEEVILEAPLSPEEQANLIRIPRLPIRDIELATNGPADAADNREDTGDLLFEGML